VKQRTVRVTISGRVQGVGFRAWTQRRAVARGLSGWVCNRRDGSVEAVFSGTGEAVAAMLAESRVGPRGARVDSISVAEVADHPTGQFIVRATV
jgi:acylphosphatase